MSQLGSAMQRRQADYGPLADLIAGMRADITEDIESAILAKLPGLLADAVAKIQVTAPAVSVTTPEVVVNVETPGEDDAGEIAAMNANTDVLKQISNQLGTLAQQLAKPTTTVVERDAQRYITRTVESRG